MDPELKQHLEAMERRIIANIEGRIIANSEATGGPIDAHSYDSLARFETAVHAAIIDLRDVVTRGSHEGFEQMRRRFDAQDQILDREDVPIEECIRVMNDNIKRMDKLLASRSL